MFCLIQRGQLFVDQHNSIVLIHSYTDKIIRYVRNGRINTSSFLRFNSEFERIEHDEAKRIQHELETELHIKKLRSMRKS
jgi:hypothetical protein